MRPPTVVLVFAAVAGLAMAGCGSSDNGSGSTSASTSGGGSKPSGDPVKIAFIVDHTGLPGNNFGELSIGAKAAANYINKQFGGVRGRPIEVTDCDSKYDAGATLACANQAIADKVVATGGLALDYGSDALARVVAAGIPSLNDPTSQQENTNPGSFGIGPAIIGMQYAGVRWIAEQKPKSVAALFQETASTHQFAGIFKTILKQRGYQGDFNAVFVSPTAVDLAPALAKVLASKPDWLWVSWANYPAALKALRQAGYKGNVISYGVVEDVPTYLAPAGSAGDGIHIVTEFKSFDDTSDPEVKVYREAMGNSSVARAEFTQYGFATVMTAYEAMKQLKGDISGPNLLSFLKQVPSLHVFMAADMVKGDAPKDYPALRAIKAVRVVQWKDGKLVQIAGPLNGSPSG